jgi:hypothetical protein
MKRRLTPLEKAKLPLVEEMVIGYGHDLEELIALLGVSMEDIIERFPDRMLDVFGDEVVLEDEPELEPEEDEDETPERSW